MRYGLFLTCDSEPFPHQRPEPVHASSGFAPEIRHPARTHEFAGDAAPQPIDLILGCGVHPIRIEFTQTAWNHIRMQGKLTILHLAFVDFVYGPMM